MSKRTCGHGTTQNGCPECQAAFYRAAVPASPPATGKPKYSTDPELNAALEEQVILDFEQAEKVRMDTWAAGDVLMGAGFIREESEAAYRSALESMAQRAIRGERELCAQALEAEMKPFVVHGSSEHISRETLRMAANFLRTR